MNDTSILNDILCVTIYPMPTICSYTHDILCKLSRSNFNIEVNHEAEYCNQSQSWEAGLHGS